MYHKNPNQWAKPGEMIALTIYPSYPFLEQTGRTGSCWICRGKGNRYAYRDMLAVCRRQRNADASEHHVCFPMELRSEVL
jgi:hypothetical protein